MDFVSRYVVFFVSIVNALFYLPAGLIFNLIVNLLALHLVLLFGPPTEL